MSIHIRSAHSNSTRWILIGCSTLAYWWFDIGSCDLNKFSVGFYTFCVYSVHDGEAKWANYGLYWVVGRNYKLDDKKKNSGTFARFGNDVYEVAISTYYIQHVRYYISTNIHNLYATQKKNRRIITICKAVLLWWWWLNLKYVGTYTIWYAMGRKKERQKISPYVVRCGFGWCLFYSFSFFKVFLSHFYRR